jgi:hypothetical protein
MAILKGFPPSNVSAPKTVVEVKEIKEEKTIDVFSAAYNNKGEPTALIMHLEWHGEKDSPEFKKIEAFFRETFWAKKYKVLINSPA